MSADYENRRHVFTHRVDSKTNDDNYHIRGSCQQEGRRREVSRSNYDKPFYVDVGTSIVAIRCASNHDVIWRKDQ